MGKKKPKSWEEQLLQEASSVSIGDPVPFVGEVKAPTEEMRQAILSAQARKMSQIDRRELARRLAPAAFARMVELMYDPDGKVAVAAADKVMVWAHGLPRQDLGIEIDARVEPTDVAIARIAGRLRGLGLDGADSVRAKLLEMGEVIEGETVDAEPAE